MVSAAELTTGYLVECFHSTDTLSPLGYRRHAADTPAGAVRWIRVALRTVSAAPLDPEADAIVWAWLQGGDRDAIRDLTEGRPVGLTITHQGERLQWTVQPVRLHYPEPSAGEPPPSLGLPPAPVPRGRRGTYPVGPPGGIRVAYESTVTELGPNPQPVRTDDHTQTPGQAMRWIRRRLRAVSALMDPAEQQRAAAWLDDDDTLFDAVLSLALGRPVVTEWTAGSVHVRLTAVPARIVRAPEPGTHELPAGRT